MCGEIMKLKASTYPNVLQALHLTTYIIALRLACTIVSMDFVRISKWFKQFLNEFKKNQTAMNMSLLSKNMYSLNIIKVVL